jgi:hypothetical protein
MRASTVVLIGSLLAASAVHAQPGTYWWGPWGAPELGDPNSFYAPREWVGNPKYDGRFTFVRVKYRGFGRYSRREGPGWAHDYPRADSHLMRIVGNITAIKPFIEQGPIIGSTILALDDPLLSRYPVAYLSEPAAWHPTESETQALRNYIKKGGFVIFDDFRIENKEEDWANFVATMRQVLPGYKILPLPATHVIFDSFFRIDFNKLRQSRLANEGEFFAVFKDNDPAQRIMAVVNFNQDIGDFWQFSDRGFNVVPSNEAYKLGVNYLIYALTH